VWDYYSGRAVDQGWVFDEHLPPLWSDIAAYLRSESVSISVEAPHIEYPEPLPEWIHLLVVLPMESLRKLLPAKKHTLARTHPWYWPTSWSLFDVGRSQMWECEAVIPLIPERLLRSLIG
jgi:5'-3' exonuclease